MNQSELFKEKQFFTESATVYNCLDDSSIAESSISNDEDNRILLKGVLCTVLNERNINGRIYPVEEMQKALDKAKEYHWFENRRLLCSADDHPTTDFVPPSRASHIVTDAYIKKIDGKDYLFNDWLILNTANGRDLAELIKAKAALGTSIRGFGEEDADHNIHDYLFIGTDVVGDPSAGTYSRVSELPKIQVESVKVNDRVRILESQLNDNHGTSLKESVEDKNTVVKDTKKESKEVNTMDLELELMKFERKNKGKLNEQTLASLITLRNKALSEGVDVESVPMMKEMIEENVAAIKSAGKAKEVAELAVANKQVKEAKDTINKLVAEANKRICEAKSKCKELENSSKKESARLNALRKVNKESAKRESELNKTICEANKKIESANRRAKKLEARVKAFRMVMKAVK